MQLFVRLPIFTADATELERRRTTVNHWWKHEGLPEIKVRYGFSGANARCLGPGHDLELLDRSADPILVRYPERPGALVPKGVLLRLEILSALEWIDRADPRARDDAYFVMIDGSGAFDLANLFSVLDRLLSLPRVDVVFGQRPPHDTGMPTWRRAIELFEERLLVQQYPSELRRALGSDRLPDSQAGCWGFRLSAAKCISLTARSYELEFDLLSSAVICGAQIAFVGPLVMRARGTSEFGARPNDATAVRASIQKLKFIMQKLCLTAEEIVASLAEYEKEVSADPTMVLPPEYVDAVEAELIQG
jgi:hypothetical protein